MTTQIERDMYIYDRVSCPRASLMVHMLQTIDRLTQGQIHYIIHDWHKQDDGNQLYSNQMDPFQIKLHSILQNILDIFIKPIPLCSSSSSPLSEPNCIFLAPLLLKLTYVAMLYILQPAE